MHIQRHLKRHSLHTEQPSPVSAIKQTRRSEVVSFNFKEKCIFCGDTCNVVPNPKNPTRWRKAKLCRTADRGQNQTTFKEVIQDTCHKRTDEWSKQVQIRIQGAVSDLHAADARYHVDCRLAFMSPCSVERSTNQQNPEITKCDAALEHVISTMDSNRSYVWTSVEVHNHYLDKGGNQHSRSSIVKEVSEYFGKDLLLLSATGLANILMFRSRATDLVKIEDDPEDDTCRSISKIARLIAKESKDLSPNKQVYLTRMNKSIASQSVSSTLSSLLCTITQELDSTLPALLIGNIVTSVITNRPTSLQIALSVLVKEKSLIEQLYGFGITCSYYEMLRFKASAAAAATKDKTLRGILDSDTSLIQAIADNFDADISSQNGLQSTHSLALLLSQLHSDGENSTEYEETIPRLTKLDMKTEVTTNVPIQIYQGPKKPDMPESEAKLSILPLRVLAQQNISRRRAYSLDITFL
jgi:hypothetical protein